jgi:transcriptional regulator with XRE-family HTH domain
MKAINLINYFKNKGLNGSEIAKILGTTRATVSRIESGEIEKMNMDMLEKAAQKLNKTASELLLELEK